MKAKLVLIFVAACIRPASAQVTVEETLVAPAPPANEIVTKTTIERSPEDDIITKTAVTFDAAYAQQHLLVLPQDALVPEQTPGTPAETTDTKEHMDVPGQLHRVYEVERNIVTVEGKELSYITIPVLFEKETAKLLDEESRVALEETASAIQEVLKTQPTAVFDIESHTSTIGGSGYNVMLSGNRARQVLLELKLRYHVPAAALSAHGYGEMFANFPDGFEEEMELDHRVLIVRKQ